MDVIATAESLILQCLLDYRDLFNFFDNDLNHLFAPQHASNLGREFFTHLDNNKVPSA